MTEAEGPPLFTVILPTRNEARFIDRCLRSIFAAEPIPGGLEVLVVDGLSDDGTQQIVADWTRRQPNLRLLRNPQRIAPTAMNIGIQAARGSWILILGSHCEYPADYFTRCLELAQRTGADNVGGSLITLSSDDTVQGRVVRALTTHPFGVGNAGFRTGARAGWADTVAYGCYRRDVFHRIGLYDERLVRNQDYEFNRRLLKQGGSIWHDPALQVRYYNQGSLRGLLRQAFSNGKWNPLMWFVAPYAFAWRHAVPLAFAAALLSGLLLLLVLPSVAVPALALIGLPYLLLALIASYQQSVRYGRLMLVTLPFCFAAYHVTYGLGGLWGIALWLTRRAPLQSRSPSGPAARAPRAWPERVEKTHP